MMSGNHPLRSVAHSTASEIRRAFLVGVALGPQAGYRVEDNLQELAELTHSAGVRVVGQAIQRRPSPEPATFIGRGKAEEVAAEAKSLGADLVVFDDDLSPSQVKNLETALGVQVMDRSALILEIFNQRARSSEARTQVELAQLRYTLPRLTRLWRHLSRQEGSMGARGGEGETQLEADRRVLRRRIQRLERELEKIERTREVQRRGRQAAATVALAGYTNAGKSTLFNALTHSDALTEDRLFATLDSKLRRGSIGEGEVAVFADTVGFIRKLPHHLVASFRSTLEEVTCADLVLHVVDRSHPRWEEQRDVAQEVLAELGVEPDRVLLVYNKIDRLADEPLGVEEAAWVSARTGAGVDELRRLISRRLAKSSAALAAR
jgi:GTP-binding protein HflX